VERRVPSPMFSMSLFKIRMFWTANLSNFLASLARGGLQFLLIIWLQGIWLPLHGYRFEDTPLWSAIYMTPMLAAFAIAGPVCGWLSDRLGPTALTTTGMILNVIGFVGLAMLPINFSYPWFALCLCGLGAGQGMFASPNTAAIMNCLPAADRGAGSGMRSTFQNSAQLLSIGVFFTILIAALATSLTPSLDSTLRGAGLPANVAERAAHVPPTSALFAAFLGYNPVGSIVPADVLDRLPARTRETLLGQSFFPELISKPFSQGLDWAFGVSASMCAIAALASLMRGKPCEPEAQEPQSA
jgi:MFS family permease